MYFAVFPKLVPIGKEKVNSQCKKEIIWVEENFEFVARTMRLFLARSNKYTYFGNSYSPVDEFVLFLGLLEEMHEFAFCFY